MAWRPATRWTDRVGSRNPEVDAWFERYDNPLKELDAVVRAWCDTRDP